MRTVAVGLALALLAVGGCSAHMPIERQQLFLNIAHVSAGDAPIVCGASFFDRGIVQYGCSDFMLFAHLSDPELLAFHSMTKDPEWQRLITAIAAHNYSSQYHDYEVLAIHYKTGKEFSSAIVPSEAVPPELLPYLRRIDATLEKLFGNDYKTHFEPRRTSPNP